MSKSCYKSAERTETMSTVPAVPPLKDGVRLTQAEFHRRYSAYPEDVKAELIGGTYTWRPRSAGRTASTTRY